MYGRIEGECYFMLLDLVSIISFPNSCLLLNSKGNILKTGNDTIYVYRLILFSKPLIYTCFKLE